MYRKVETDLNFLPREQEVLQFWKENHVFEQSVALRRGAPAYTFYDGPPTANGSRTSAISSRAASRTSSPATAR